MATPVLPYPDMDFTPLDILTAAEMDQMVANDQYLRDFCAGLADGTNLSDGVIQARKLDFSTFSTQEQIIGEWTDGKTLYRKVVDTGVISGADNIIVNALSGVSDLVDARGYWMNTTNNSKAAFGGAFSAVVSDHTLVQSTRAILYTSGEFANKVRLQFTQARGTPPTGVRMVVALDYTKVS